MVSNPLAVGDASEEPRRSLDVIQSGCQQRFPPNAIHTTRYSPIPWHADFFLWQGLYEQFLRRANLYFVVISALQVIPGVSPTGRFTTLGTLICVLLFSMARSFSEDVMRFLRDRKQNSREVTILDVSTNSWKNVPVCEVQPGTVIKVSNEADAPTSSNMFPCDCVLLSCASPKGECLVETSTLDGETNLKTRQCVWQQKRSRGLSPSACVEAFGNLHLSIDEPSPDLSECYGFIEEDGKRRDFSIVSTGLRGCYLKRTLWVVAVAVYTGRDTKVMKNRQVNKPVKKSSVEKQVNWLLVIVLAILLTLCIISLFGNMGMDSDLFYLAPERTQLEGSTQRFLTFLTFLVLFNNFIPISLYVSLEIIKALQSVMMAWDLCMYSAKADQRLVVHTSELNEELGQITHLLCDKTGTLTKNKMSFKKFCASGAIFGQARSNAERALENTRYSFFGQGTDPLFSFFDERLPSLDYRSVRESDGIREFFVCCALCHSCITEGDKLEAEFPDEETLVYAASKFGVRFVSHENGVKTIEWGTTGIFSHYEVLHVVPFTPQRRKMTVVVREVFGSARFNDTMDVETVESVNLNESDGEAADPVADEVWVITKGAEESVSEGLTPEHEFRSETIQSARQLASQGLRTMMFASKRMTLQEWSDWSYKFSTSSTSFSTEERDDDVTAPVEKKTRNNAIKELECELESNLHVNGASGVEDTLQTNAAHTISNLRTAGVKVWVVSGDHVSTAKKIALMCGVLRPSDEVLDFTSDHIKDGPQLSDALGQSFPQPFVIIMDGAVMDILGDQDMFAAFYVSATDAVTVLGSRFSPKQKLHMVEMLKSFDTSARILGVGDGANDVPMLEACHVGVGMFGNEGQQAVNAADYGIAEFEFLHRLLLVHGRANYTRLTKVICYFFYKNALLVSTQFWYCLFNRFSGQSLYEGLTFALYNVLFTSFPCIVLGIFDRDVLDTDNIHAHPELYKPGPNDDGLNAKVFTRWILEGLLSSVATFYMIILAQAELNDGRTMGEAEVGLIVYTAVIVATTVRIAIEVRSWTTLHMFTIVVSLAFGWIFYFVFGEMADHSGPMYKLSLNIGFKISVWLIGMNATFVAMLPLIIVIYVATRLLPPTMLSLSFLIALKDSRDIDAATRAPQELGGGVEDEENVIELGSSLKRAASRNNFKTLVGSNRTDRLQKENHIVVAGLFSTFDDTSLELQFRQQLVGDLSRYKTGALICSVGSTVIVIANFFMNISLNERIAWGVFALISVLTYVTFRFAAHSVSKSYHSALLVLCFGGFSCVSIANLNASQNDPNTHPVTLGILMMGLISVTRPPFFDACQYMFIGLLSYAGWYQAFSVREWEVTEMSLRGLEIVVVAGISLLRLAVREYFLRAVFAADQSAQNALALIAEEEARSYLLLKSVLPASIVELVQSQHLGLSLFNVAFSEGSYLQSDIVMFTKFSSGHESTVVIEMLNRMFTKFDSLSNLYKVEKIKTIGDAYICCSGVPVPDPYHAQRIILVALGLSHKMDEMNEEGLSTLRHLDLHVRVGVASGGLIGGVVGKSKVAYDVFGEAKERADILEQTGLPGRVHCTQEMAAKLTNWFTFEELPGKGGEIGYFVKECVDSSFLEVETTEIEEESALVPHLNPSTRPETYRFLDDDDTQRVQFTSTWRDFNGESNKYTMTFHEQHAEQEFVDEVEHLASSRAFHDMILGAAFFCLTGVICVMAFVGQRQHPFVLVLFGGSFLHFMGAAVVEFASTQNSKSSTAISFWKKTRRFGRAIAETANTSDVKKYLKASAMLSAFLSLSTSIVLPIIFDEEQTSTITVFVTIGATAHGLGFLYFRVTTKLIVLVLHLLATTSVFIWREYDRWDAGVSGDAFALIIAYLFVAIDIIDFEKQVRTNYVVSRKLLVREAGIESAVSLSEKLLLNVLPPVVITKLRTYPDRQVVDVFGSASVMFIYSNIMDIDLAREADDAIVSINKVLFLIDQICKDAGAEKIKTSPYMLVCGLPVPNEDHAITLTKCAMKIFSEVDQFNKETPSFPIKVKIGINTGKISAGVLGKTKFQYDVFGDTVNLASRLTSYGDWGTLTIGAETRSAVSSFEPHLIFNDHGNVELKGKGMVHIQQVDLARSSIDGLDHESNPVVGFGRLEDEVEIESEDL